MSKCCKLLRFSGSIIERQVAVLHQFVLGEVKTQGLRDQYIKLHPESIVEYVLVVVFGSIFRRTGHKCDVALVHTGAKVGQISQ